MILLEDRERWLSKSREGDQKGSGSESERKWKKFGGKDEAFLPADMLFIFCCG